MDTRPSGDHLVALLLALMASVRLWRAWKPDWRRVVYIVAAGLIACLPDYIGRLGAPVNFVDYLNAAAHRWWFVPYLQMVLDYPESRPIIVLACLVAELTVCGASACLLFGRLPKGEGVRITRGNNLPKPPRMMDSLLKP
ncbi:MAG: hypothetical protein ACUVX8_02800 [Candidatus Zipacnadales bacterium]